MGSEIYGVRYVVLCCGEGGGVEFGWGGVLDEVKGVK